MRLRPALFCSFVLVVVSIGCSRSSRPDAAPATIVEATLTVGQTAASTTMTVEVATSAAEASTTAEPVETTSAVPLALPDTPAGRQLAWVVENLAEATDKDIEAHFSAEFVAQVPPAGLRSGIADLGELIVTEVVSSEPETLVVLVDSGQGKLVVTIKVDVAEPHVITGLQAQPGELPDAPTTWAGVEEALANAGAASTYAAVEIADDGSQRVIQRSQEQGSVPLGSSFKIYVLGALVQAIEQGDVRWDDQLTITDELKSLPSGELQDRPSGSTVTVQEAAEKMIQISDNTATDLLIDRLGRDRVEAILSTMGMGAESQRRTLPFITTLELFTLKWGIEPEELQRYVVADTDQRRALLTALAGRRPDIARFDPQVPVANDTVEWFATPTEIVTAHVWLDDYRQRPGFEPLAGILGSNPGVPLDESVWTDVAFKGGSEPGVVFLGHLLHRADGRRFVVVVSAIDPSVAVDELQAVAASEGAIGLLTDEP
jgi:beta-lactamase class A